MRKLAIAGIIWAGFVVGLVAVAIANRPEGWAASPAPKSNLDRLLVHGASQPGLLEAWSSTYTLVLVLGTIVAIVAVVVALTQGTSSRLGE